MQEDGGESTGAPAEELPGPGVQAVTDGDVVRITVAGELTEAARRPLVRELTELLLGGSAVRAVELDLRDISFMNSAGMAVLVQLQRMTAPRGIEVVLVEPASVVARPLQLSGLWRRFPIRQGADDEDDATGS